MKRFVEMIISHKEYCPIFDESVTRIYIDDEGAGEFICVEQFYEDKQTIKLNPEEIDMFIDALREMNGLIREESK